MRGQFIDLENQRFGRLTATEYQGHRRWLCVCDCGNAKIIEGYSIRNGLTQSCGCLHKERNSAVHYKHGKCFTRTYKSWATMIQRCTNPNSPRYFDWGGRGITVCDRWRDFRNFLDDMGECPPKLTIERIDNNGNYEPTNCHWVTQAVNNQNKRPYKRHLSPPSAASPATVCRLRPASAPAGV
jgi:hypothetical protein